MVCDEWSGLREGMLELNVRTVDVQPEVVRFADGGEGDDRVVGAENRGAGGGVEVEWRVAFFFRLGDERGQGRGVHAAGLWVHGDRADGRGAEAEHLSRLRDAVVGVGGGEEDELQVVGRVAVSLGFGVEGVAGDYYGRDVGIGASWDGHAACMGPVEAEEIG